MIASLRGRVAATRPGAIVLDVGGVGYLVAATTSAARRGGGAGAGAVESVAGSADAGGDDHAAARDALVGLGMSVAEAEVALREVDEDAPIEERVRLALAGSLTGAA